MLAERELACDELVLAGGAPAEDYASAIGKVCAMALTGNASYAGITGPSLKKRLEQIMSTPAVRNAPRLLRALPGCVAAVALLLRARRRRLQLAAAHAWTEPLDLQTLRARMRIVEPEAQATGLRHTRELLDDLRRQRTDVGPGFGGIAGSSRRR